MTATKATASFEPEIEITRLNDGEPIIARQHFIEAGVEGLEGANINGPTVIRVPDWIPPHERPAKEARYYMYFAHHAGRYIRMAYAENPVGPWRLFNTGDAVGRSLGHNEKGIDPRKTPGNGVLDLDLGDSDKIDTGQFRMHHHVASPDVLIDHENRRLAMYFHAPSSTGRQETFVATSRYGLNFNQASDGGETFENGQSGVRDVIPGWFYFRTFEVSGRTFSYANGGRLYRAPAKTAAGEPATLANADAEGGLWNPLPDDSREQYWETIEIDNNPIQRFYRKQGREETDPRHFAVVHAPRSDPDKLLVIYSSKFDAPERLFLTIFDLEGLDDDERIEPANWKPLEPFQILLLTPEKPWEGGDLPITKSRGGAATDERALRDPFLLKDHDDRLYLYYSGRGEAAIGVAELGINL